ncbi:hypothetical protein CDD81_2766 [Ophiocordyceps australis]|uniref:DUF2415 domain-containing protein n=1 Tax=Ophiocordyceps australis TaxID=1399860 RepID=A0A2C5YEE5_9HYPO|nr:hypothetical protein CDD81_2766 [Ophiocordyceps australis]
MAVSEDSPIYPTESLVSKKGRKHYRTPVRSQHWQLRSLISVEKQHLVYFPSGTDSNLIQRLNIKTRECETIKLLKFAPRCLAADNGWLCCGSETGDFFAMRLNEDRQSQDLRLGSEVDDNRSTMGTDDLGDDPILSLISQARQSNKNLVGKSIKLAKDRVNCVTLWFPPKTLAAAQAAYKEPVAVLANNDRTVVLVSLADFDQDEKATPLDVVTYPDYVNRAVISPDGRLLCAILDDPYLYVHERVERSSMQPLSNGTPTVDNQWELKQRLLLKSQRKGDQSDSRGSFAACFSSTGTHLAVGTQHGTISIFNTALLTDSGADPLLTCFRSSRPKTAPGAIRDMAFCPGPFDILAWTEDRGHIGVADMRSNCVTRQIIDIDVETDFEHIDVFDGNAIDPRLLSASGERRSSRLSPSGATRRRYVDRLEGFNQPLTASETLVLEAIQGDRRRRERLMRWAAEEVSAPASNAGIRHVGGLRPSASDGEQRLRERSSSVGRTTGDLLASYREQRDRFHARELVNENGTERQSARRPADLRLMERIGETVAAMRDQRERPDASYLNVLEILQSRDRSSGESEHEDPSLLVPLVHQAMSRWEDSGIRGTLATVDRGTFDVPPSPDNTAGLSWSADGRTLFVGAQNGIYELCINVQGRKLCPSISMS